MGRGRQLVTSHQHSGSRDSWTLVLRSLSHFLFSSGRQAMGWCQSHSGKLPQLPHRNSEACLIGGFKTVNLTLNTSPPHKILLYSQLELMLLTGRLVYFRMWLVSWTVFTEWQISAEAFAESRQGSHARLPATLTCPSEPFYPHEERRKRSQDW